MNADAEAKLFAAARALMHQPSFGDDSLAGKHERATLLEVVDEYVNSEYPDEHWFAVLKAKAAVCDAYLAQRARMDAVKEPGQRLAAEHFAGAQSLLDAVAALRALQEKKTP